MNQTIFSKELSSNLRNSLFLYRNYKQIVLGMFVIIALTNPVHAEDLAQDPTAKPTETKPLKDIEFLGMKLIDANLNSVRSHLWDVGGFLQAKTTVKQRNIDKFFLGQPSVIAITSPFNTIIQVKWFQSDEYIALIQS